MGQGGIIGQYSVLFGEELSFSVTSETVVRVLTLPDKFFSIFCQTSTAQREQDTIDGLEEAIDRAQKHVDEFGVPICDFKVYKNSLK